MQTKEEVFGMLRHKQCWRVWRGGRAAIFFELGGASTVKKDLESQRGVYTLGISPCSWQILQGGKLLLSDQSDFKKMDELLPLFVDKQLLDIQIDQMPGHQTVFFSGELTLRLWQTNANDEWYILTPELEMVITQDKVDISPFAPSLLR